LAITRCFAQVFVQKVNSFSLCCCEELWNRIPSTWGGQRLSRRQEKLCVPMPIGAPWCLCEKYFFSCCCEKLWKKDADTITPNYFN